MEILLVLALNNLFGELCSLENEIIGNRLEFTRIMNPLDQFKDAVSAHVPGLLVLFKFADAKRRNCHLGYQLVDKDIEEFDRLLQSSVGPSGLAKRVRGASWLAMYNTESLQSISALLLAYQNQQEIHAGWTCSAEKDGVSKVAECATSATITRAMRCLYAAVTDLHEIDSLIDRLLHENYGFPPSSPLSLADAMQIKRTTWNCVSHYPSQVPFCPFCERSEFDCDDADGSVYTGSGACKTCGAQIDIRTI